MQNSHHVKFAEQFKQRLAEDATKKKNSSALFPFAWSLLGEFAPSCPLEPRIDFLGSVRHNSAGGTDGGYVPVYFQQEKGKPCNHSISITWQQFKDGVNQYFRKALGYTHDIYGNKLIQKQEKTKVLLIKYCSKIFENITDFDEFDATTGNRVQHANPQRRAAAREVNARSLLEQVVMIDDLLSTVLAAKKSPEVKKTVIKLSLGMKRPRDECASGEVANSENQNEATNKRAKIQLPQK